MNQNSLPRLLGGIVTALVGIPLFLGIVVRSQGQVG